MTSALLLAAVGDLARQLPLDQVELLADFLEDQPDPVPAVADQAKALVPTPAFSTNVGALVGAWSAERDSADGVVIAAALRATARAIATERDQQHVEVVWTGPTAGVVPVRLTYAVLLEVIGSARRKLTLFSFAAYKVPNVSAGIQDAVTRGVDVRLVLDDATDAKNAFTSLGDRVRFLCWNPTDQQPGQKPPSMHAKCALADDHLAFVTSANLTGKALEENMELGLLVRGGAVPRRLAAHFDSLINTGVLAP